MTSLPPVGGLGWGRRFLMCPPEHFGVLYEINPWMHREVAVDLDRAREQWGELVATLVEAGAEVERVAELDSLLEEAYLSIVERGAP